MTLRQLFAFAAVLLVLRVLLLLADLDPIPERVMQVFEYSPVPWAAGPERTLYDREELYTATAAEAIRRNLGIPLSRYQFMEYGGGSLAVTLLAVPVLGALGPYYLAFKVIPLAVTLLGGVAWTWLAFAWFGRTAGWAMSILYVLAPSVLVRTMLIAKGDHAEAAAWIGLTLVLASLAARDVLGCLPGEEGYSLQRTDAEDPLPASTRSGSFAGSRWAFAAGLALGLGVFLTYSTVPVLATAFVIALAVTRMKPRRIWTAGWIGLGVGLLPWFWNLLQSEGRALQVYGSTLGQGRDLTDVGERIGSLVSTGFFAAYDLPAIRNLAGFLFGAAVVVGWIVLARMVLGRSTRARSTSAFATASSNASTGASRGASTTASTTASTSASTSASRGASPNASASVAARVRSPRNVAASVGVLAALAHLLAFCVSAPDASSRYVIPAYPLLLLAVASVAGVARLRASTTRRRFSRAWILPGLVALLGGAAQVNVLATGSYRSLATPLRATDWPLLGEIMGQKIAPDGIARLPEPLQRHFWVGFGKRVFGFVDRAQWEEAFALAPPHRRAAIWEGIGIGWVESGRVLEAGGFVDQLAEADRAAIVRGMGRYGELVFAPMIVSGEDLASIRTRMAGSSGSPLAPVQARVFGVLERNGAPVRGPRGLFAEEVAAGQGWAAYGGINGRGRIIRGPSVEGFPLEPGSRGSSAPGGTPAHWSGFAAAFTEDLALVDPEWVLEPHHAEGPTHLGRMFDRSARDLDAAQAAALYAAAGRAAANAWLDPSLGDEARARRSAWAWKQAIPETQHAAFEAGLRGPTDD